MTPIGSRIKTRLRLQASHGIWLALFLVCVVLQSIGARDDLRFDRTLIDQGHLWLLLSGHLVHLNWAHFALNMASLALIAFAFGAYGEIRHWLGALVISGLFSSVGVYYLNPETTTVVGLSAVLHGLFLYGAALETERDRMTGFVLLTLLFAKLIWELTSGAMPGSESVVGGYVITDAHLYGAIGGACSLILFSPATLVRWIRPFGQR